MERLSRRQVLAATGTATLPLAGCVGFGGFGGTNERITVETLDVEGSPGGEMVVNPPETAVLLDFFATWCQPCKPQMAELGEVGDRYPDLHMLSVSWEQDTEAIREFWAEYDGRWPVAQDTELRVAEAYEIDGRLPTKIVLDVDGDEVWRDVGLSEADTIAEHVEEVLDP